MTRGLTGVVLKLFLAMLLLFVAIAAEAATVSGTVTNNSGVAGRVFISGQWAGGGNAGWGKSVQVGAFGSASYTIRGVQDGTYTVQAFLDTQNRGIQFANDPVGFSPQFSVSFGADTSNVNLTLNNPAAEPLQPPLGAGAVAGDGGVMVFMDIAKSASGKQIATSHKVYWSISPNPGPTNTTGGGSSPAIAPASDADVYIKQLSNGSVFYFAVTSLLNGAESAPVNANGGAPVTVGPATGGVTLSGTINISGATLSSATPLYFALATINGPPSNIARVASPSASQAYSIAGVAPGSYSLYVIVDMNNNGVIDIGDISNTNSDGIPVTVADSDLANVNMTISAANAQITVNTSHGKQGSSEWYGLNLTVGSMLKRPVNVAASGPNLSNGTIDLGLSNWGAFEAWPGLSARPNLAPPDNYFFDVEYSDGSTTGASPLVSPVTGIVDSFATPVSPVGYVPFPFSPTDFSWSAPASPPSSYTYSFWLEVPGFNDEGFWGMPSSTTSVSYPSYTDYQDGNSYQWNISVRDSLGNSAQNFVSFVSTTSPVISGFTPSFGGPGTAVTISGFNFDGTTASNNSVFFSGSTTAATVIGASQSQLQVLVPGDAPTSTGPITVHVGAKMGQSSGSFTVDATAPFTTASPSGGTQTGPINVFLTTNEPATIFYTTNGADPTTSSPSFTDGVGNVAKGPIAISSNTTLKFFSRDLAGNLETVKQEVYFYGTPTTLSLGLSSGSITYGDSVTATATLDQSAATGSVSFFVDGVPYGGPVPVSLGSAQMTVSGLGAAGSPHTILAQYSGDSTYSASSNSTSVSVAKAAQTTAVTLSVAPTATYAQTGLFATAFGGDGTGAYVYSSGASTACSVNSATGAMSITSGSGSCSITATRAADGNYLASAASSPASVTVSKATATVVLSGLSQQFDGTAKPITVTTIPPGLAVSIDYAGSATVPSAIGSYAVTVTVNDANYSGGATGTLQIAAGFATVSIGNLSQTYDGTAKPVTVTTTPSGLAVDVTYNGLATVPVAADTYAVVATVNDTNYAGSASATLVVAKADQTLTFGALPGRTYGDSPVSLVATASSSLPVTFSSSDPTVVTVTGSTATILKAGSVTITASQSGDGNYNAAVSVGQTLTVAQKTLTISGTSVASKVYDANRSASITSLGSLSGVVGADVVLISGGSATFDTSNVGSGKTVTVSGLGLSGADAANYSLASTTTTTTADITQKTLNVNADAKTKTYNTADPALTYTSSGLAGSDTISGGLSRLAGENVGTYAIQQGTLSAGGNYTIVFSGANLTITKADQTIAFGALATKNTIDVPFNLTATASSSLPVSYASSNSAVATVNGSTVTIVGAGTTTITASQAGDANWNAAADVSQVLTVTTGQTITVTTPAPASAVFGSSFTVAATANSGLTVTYSSGSPSVCTNAGATFTMLSGSGSCVVLYDQAGDATYLPAPQVTSSVAAAKAPQAAVTVAVPASASFGQGGLVAVASGGSGSGGYIFSAGASTACSVNASTGAIAVTSGSGSCSISATRQSDSNFAVSSASAAAVMTINKAAATVTLSGLSQVYNGSARVATATTSPAGQVVNITYDGSATAPTSAGTYAVVATINSADYQGSASGNLVIAKAAATISVSNLIQTEDGTPKGVTITTTPASLALNVTYNGSAAIPATAGTYNVVVTVNDANYQGSTIAVLDLLAYGDISGGPGGVPDGSVNIVDAYNYLLMSLKLTAPPAYNGNLLLAPIVGGKPTAVPGSRAVNVLDVRAILEKVAGLW